MFATILKPNDINMLFEIDEKDILILDEELIVHPLTAPEKSITAAGPKASEQKESKPASEAPAADQKKPEEKQKAKVIYFR